MSDALIVEEIQILAEQADDSVLVSESEVIEVVAVAEQGPPGIDGSVAGGALLAVNKLGEFASSTTDQLAAQQNLGLGVIDPLAYYILAKA